MRHAAATALMFACACSHPVPRGAATPEAEPPAEPGVFDHIEADTPYLFAILEPARDPHLDATLAALGESLALSARLPGGPRAVSRAITGVLGGPLDRARLERLGLDLDRPIALSGLGLYPVLRIAARDARALAAAVDRIAETTALAPGEPGVWTAAIGRGVLVLGLGGGQLGIALVPRALAGELAPAIAGVRPPRRSLADSGAVDELARRHRLRERVGFVDVVAATRAVFGPGSHAVGDVAVAALVDTLGVPFPRRCRDALVDLAAAVPRLLYGVRARSARREQVLVSLEVDGAIGARLVAATSAMPGLDGHAARTAELAVGLGVRPAELLELLADGLDALAAAPACDLERELGVVRDQLRVTAGSLRPIAGLALALARYGDDLAEIRGVGAALLDDPDAFYAALAAWLPGISIARGQTAQIPVPTSSPGAFVHAGDEIVAVGVGLDHPDPVDEFASLAAATTASTLLRLTARGQLAQRWQRRAPEPELEAMAPDLARRLSELLTPIRYRTIDIEVRPRRERVDVAIDLELAPPE